MPTLRLSPFLFAWLPGRLGEAAKRAKAPPGEERSLAPLPSTLAEEPIQDWERLWIDLGGEG
jgi:hypothetical protein